MLRASAVCESAGIPSSSLCCEGFLGQAANTADGLGMPNLPVAMVPGHVDTQTHAELETNVLTVTVDLVVENLTRQPDEAVPTVEPDARDIVFEGSFEEVNRLFLENSWSDGLPVVPPTQEKVEQFLAFTDLDPETELGIALPDNRAVTVWSVAVQGVMAGCRPEYMPVLVAAAQAMVDPEYGLEHSGNTPGSETLITVSGPIVGDLGFNYEQGVLRDGFQPNTSIGRWFRLMLRNVAGFLLHQTDKGTYGGTWRVVLAENEQTLAEMGWEPISADFGYAAGDNVVTISRYTGGGVITSVFGQHPDEMVPYLADALVKQSGWELVFAVGLEGKATYRPLLLLSPILAKTIAKAGWSRQDLKGALYEKARIPASKFERYMGEWTNLIPGRRTLEDFVNVGRAPAVFKESTDPDRMVPIVGEPDDILIAVTGDPMRTNAYVLAHNGFLGYPTAKQVALPADWASKLSRAHSM